MNMITNLFSNFDPCSSSWLFYNWTRSFILFFIIPRRLWILNNRIIIIINILIKTIYKELRTLLGNSSLGRTLIFIRILIFIALNNFLGLFPYIFTSSRHLVLALSLAAPLWLAFIIFGWINNINHIFAHLVPLSTPNLLIPFIVLI